MTTLSPSNDSDSFGNGSSEVEFRPDCPDFSPKTADFLRDLPAGGYALLVVLCIFTALTIAVYVEELRFILANFKIGTRKKKTIWILAFAPVYSTCGLLAVIVPRSATLVDMVANSFFGTCLYNFGRLMVNYMGGAQKMWEIVGHDRHIKMNTPPCCCCCVCIRPQRLTRSLFFRITLQVLQVAIVRPIIMFLAAILWTNESYIPGNMHPSNAFLYITIVNVTSTLVAVYGLMIMRGAFQPELEKDFLITGKILTIQLTLLSNAIPNLIIGILVSTGSIPCGPYFPSKARGEMIFHAVLVFLMLPLALLGRKFFRRLSDGSAYAADPSTAGTELMSPAAAASPPQGAYTVKPVADPVESQKGFA